MKKKYKKCIACCGKGKVPVSNHGSPITDFQKKKILELYRKGLGVREIQREVKIKHPYSVSYYIKTCNKDK